MKMKTLMLLLLVTLPIFAAPKRKDLIGYKHKGVTFGETLPNGAKDLGGGLLSNSNYGVSRFSHGKRYMLWLEKIASRDTKGVPTWVVKDVLMFDDLKKNQEFQFSYSSGCTQNGKENLDLIVQTELLPNKNYRIIRAWRADLKKEKFDKISEKGIICKNIN